jgi:hypothetical protein
VCEVSLANLIVHNWLVCALVKECLLLSIKIRHALDVNGVLSKKMYLPLV